MSRDSDQLPSVSIQMTYKVTYKSVPKHAENSFLVTTGKLEKRTLLKIKVLYLT